MTWPDGLIAGITTGSSVIGSRNPGSGFSSLSLRARNPAVGRWRAPRATPAGPRTSPLPPRPIRRAACAAAWSCRTTASASTGATRDPGPAAAGTRMRVRRGSVRPPVQIARGRATHVEVVKVDAALAFAVVGMGPLAALRFRPLRAGVRLGRLGLAAHVLRRVRQRVPLIVQPRGEAVVPLRGSQRAQRRSASQGRTRGRAHGKRDVRRPCCLRSSSGRPRAAA